jgi:hypothetical protein
MLPAVITYLAEHELLKFRSEGDIRITRADGISGFILGVRADSIHGYAPLKFDMGLIKSIPLNFQITALSTKLSPSFVPPGLSLNIHGEMYGGKLNGALDLISTDGGLSLSGSAINLAKHPQFRGIGILGGLLSFEVSRHPINLDWRDGATYKLDLKGLDIELPGLVSGLLQGLNSIKRGDLAVSMSVKEGGSFSIKGGRIDSSIGMVEVNAEGIVGKKGGVQDLDAKIGINLIGEDSGKIIPWIPVLTKGALTDGRRSINAQIRSLSCGTDPNAIKISWGGCLKIDWW